MKFKWMFFILLVLFAVYGLYRRGYLASIPFLGSSSSELAEEDMLTDTTHPTKIVGDAAFVAQVNGCLDLLKTKSPSTYTMATQHIARILQHEKSGIDARQDEPTFKLSKKSAFYSKTWCAGVIAHDAYHVYLYREYKKEHGDDVPYDVWAGFEAEKKCHAYQLIAMRDMDAPEFEIKHLQDQDGRHTDINRDGKIDWDDYELRDW